MEVTHIEGVAITPDGARCRQPAFDVTPAKYVTPHPEPRHIYPPYEANCSPSSSHRPPR